jgi:flagellin
MRDIANQSANGTNTDKNQVALQKEFGELQKQITYIADNTQFNDKNLLKNDQTINIQTLDSSDQSKQIGISLKGITLDKLGIDSTAIGADNSAEVNLKDATTAMAKLATSDAASVKDDVAAAKAAFSKVKDQFSIKDAREIEDKFIEFDKDPTSLPNAGTIGTTFAGKDTVATTNMTSAQKEFGELKATIAVDKDREDGVKEAKDAFDLVKDRYSKEDIEKIEAAFTKFDTAKGGADKGDAAAKEIGNLFDTVKPMTTTKADALAAVDKIDEALKMVADNRATLGATLNRLDFNVNNLKSQSSSMASAASQIEDADMAKEMSEMTKFKILNEAGISMLSQANQTPQMVSKLLQ